eukprot:TRINITY_DN2172_c0_g1_i1.p1 TRINITY_DN2172_c0_g1~~TRINITY_DN2172_c0_g1_i1.p1  ORF type:complete len:435 (-),score=115.22 TRINITY_DN2172_c0_g1_i1:23-1327(-)
MTKFLLLLLATFAISALAIPFIPKEGLVNPPNHWQRFRQSEYEEYDQFFQWWYMKVSDQETGRYYAFAYGYLNGKQEKTNNGAYMMFATRSGNSSDETGFVKYEKFPLPQFTNQEDFHVTIHDDSGSLLYELHPTDNNDTFTMTGVMKNPKPWHYEGCDPTLEIEWSLTFKRVYGWYGQYGIQWIARTFGHGELAWNTHSHNSLVNGTIKIGDKVYQVSNEGTRFRGYSDMNWGSAFPQPVKPNENPFNYPWGWYQAKIPSEDSSKDISIIAGTGLTEQKDPILPAFKIFGSFADIRLGNETHVGMRDVRVFDETWAQKDAILQTNDGEVISMKVDRSGYFNFTDKWGSAQIPLRQIMTLETTNHRVVMDFDSIPENYNRLFFTYDTGIFSDFEALGVNVQVNITMKATGQQQSYSLKTGGLEYGYKVKVHFDE